MGYVRSRLSTHFSNCRGKADVDMSNEQLKMRSAAAPSDAKKSAKH